MRHLLFAMLWACAIGLAQAAPDLEAGKAKAVDKCENCHAGGPDMDGDDLGGMPADKMIKALHEYKDKTRKNAGMRKRAGELSDQDIENLAAYYAARPPKAKK